MQNWSTSKIFIVSLVLGVGICLIVAAATSAPTSGFLICICFGIVLGLAIGFFLDKRNERRSSGSWNI